MRLSREPADGGSPAEVAQRLVTPELKGRKPPGRPVSSSAWAALTGPGFVGTLQSGTDRAIWVVPRATCTHKARPYYGDGSFLFEF